MTAPDDDQLAELAAHLDAEDPGFTRQFTSDTAPRSARLWLIGTGSVVAVLLLAGTLTADVALALMVLPVSATTALLVWVQRRHARHVADQGGPPPPERAAGR